MKFAIWIVFRSFQFGGPPERTPADDHWLARDKAYHFAASAIIQGSTHALLRNTGSDYADASRWAAISTLSVGVAKEIYDRADGRYFSRKDLVADAVGVITAATLVRQWDRP